MTAHVVSGLLRLGAAFTVGELLGRLIHEAHQLTLHHPHTKET